MRRLRFSYLPVLLVLAITVLLTALLGSLYVSGVARSAREDFYSLTSLTTQIFAESIRTDMTDEQLRNITQSFLRGDVLYAQIVMDGSIVFEDRIDTASSVQLSLSTALGSFQQTEKYLASGTPYLDVIRPFAGSPGSFVRTGFSMREIENRVLSETLFVIQVGLGVILLVGFFSGLYIWLMSRRRADDTGLLGEVATSSVDGQGPVVEPVNMPVGSEPTHQVLEAGPLSIDFNSKVVSVHGEAVELSPKEFELVSLLAATPGKVFSNNEILQTVWSDGYSATSKDVKQYIYLLRRKLEPDPEKPSLIVTVRGFGYKLETGQNGQT